MTGDRFGGFIASPHFLVNLVYVCACTDAHVPVHALLSVCGHTCCQPASCPYCQTLSAIIDSILHEP